MIYNVQVTCTMKSKYMSACCFPWLSWDVMGQFLLLDVAFAEIQDMLSRILLILMLF